MSSFSGPWASNLEALQKSVQSIPEQYKAPFASASKATLAKICDPDVLSIWETDSDIDNLLQLTSVIAKLCDIGARVEKGATAKEGCAVIIVEEKKGRDNFGRVCQLVHYLTGAASKKHLEGTVVVFGKILVVRGWDNAISSGQKEALGKAISRINIAIDRALEMGGFQGEKRKIVWHHGPVVHFLLSWINSTNSKLRSALSAITVTGSLNLTNGVAPSTAGRANHLSHLQRLESYAKKLNIPVVLLDSASQLITLDHLGNYMYFFAYYINTFMPSSLSRPHLHKAQDELVTFAFRLRAASEKRYGSEVVRIVQKHLDASTAKSWARSCISASSYGKSVCLAAGSDTAIHHAVQLAYTPFSQFNSHAGVPAFARLAVGPAAVSSPSTHIAAPMDISFSNARLRPSNPATFHILLPSAPQDLEKVTGYVQGLMGAVLARVRQEHDDPVLGTQERDMWKAVVKSCTWALDGCEGKMPKEMMEKVKCVKEKLNEGTWACVLKGVERGGQQKQQPQQPQQQEQQEQNRTYGFGMQAGAAQPLGMYAGGPPQQNVSIPHGGPVGGTYPQQLPMQTPPQAFPAQIDQSAPVRLRSFPTHVHPSLYKKPSHTQEYPSAGPGPVYAPQQHRSGSYMPVQHTSGGAGYPQSMGGPW